VGSFLKLPLEEVAAGGPTMPPSHNMIETLSTISPSEGKPEPVVSILDLIKSD
ncbi:jg284, partial [Pararge aegeria aegeria]